jgi:hypothetical protein
MPHGASWLIHIMDQLRTFQSRTGVKWRVLRSPEAIDAVNNVTRVGEIQ